MIRRTSINRDMKHDSQSEEDERRGTNKELVDAIQHHHRNKNISRPADKQGKHAQELFAKAPQDMTEQQLAVERIEQHAGSSFSLLANLNEHASPAITNTTVATTSDNVYSDYCKNYDNDHLMHTLIDKGVIDLRQHQQQQQSNNDNNEHNTTKVCSKEQEENHGDNGKTAPPIDESCSIPMPTLSRNNQGARAASVPGAHRVQNHNNHTNDNIDGDDQRQLDLEEARENTNTSTCIISSNRLQENGLALAYEVTEEEDIPRADLLQERSNSAHKSRTSVTLPVMACLLVFVLAGIILVGTICGTGGYCRPGGKDVDANPLTFTKRQVELQRWLEHNAFEPDYFYNIASNDNAILDTPRQQALRWMANEDPLELDPNNSTHFLQRYVLALFYFATSQEKQWRVCNPATNDRGPDFCYYAGIDRNDLSTEMASRWLTRSHECTWAGVICSTVNIDDSPLSDSGIQEQPKETRLVQMIHLKSHGLNGNIPTELVKLSMLGNFDVGNNSLTGVLDDLSFTAFSNLKFLDLNHNQLSGTLPESLFLLPSLDFVRLDGNLLEGQIPSIVGSFSGRHLDFSMNMLTGSLPPSLSSAYKLETAFMRDNYLTGSLPTEIGLLSDMERLILQNNLLSWTIPSELGELSLLQEIGIDKNLFSGTLPEAIYNLTELVWATFSNNNLSGTISSSIGLLSETLVFDVSYNQYLCGSIPSTISGMKSLQQIFLQGTSLAGSIPESLCNSKYQSIKENYAMGDMFQTMNQNSATRELSTSFVVDCLPNRTSGIPYVACTSKCCTKCCDRETGICQDMS